MDCPLKATCGCAGTCHHKKMAEFCSIVRDSKGKETDRVKKEEPKEKP